MPASHPSILPPLTILPVSDPHERSKRSPRKMGNFRFIHPEQKRLVVTMAERLNPQEIAWATNIKKRTVQRILENQRHFGDVVRPRGAVGRPRILTDHDLAYIEGLIDRQPDIYLWEIRQTLLTALNVDVDDRTISNALHRRGFTYKQVTRIAQERNEEVRAEYQATIAELYPPETHVYLDESHCNRHVTNRRWGWAPAGDRAWRRDYFVRGTRYSILPAISLSGVLHLDIITRSWPAEEFRNYIECLLDNMNPYPLPNSVLIMDNASTHHFNGLREIVEARGMRLLYLPAYSPDLNPIEEGFSAMKAWIRRNRDFMLGEMTGEETCDPYQLLYDAVYSVMTPENIAGWYRDCGLLVYQ